MERRKERLNEAYEYLHEHHRIFKQEDLAKELGYSRSKVSLALGGFAEALTDNFLKKLCERYPFFSFDYLKYGVGTLITTPPQSIPRPEGTQVSGLVEVDGIGESGMRNLFDIAMDVIIKNEALNRQLVASIRELRSLIDRYGPPPGAEPPKPADSTDDSDRLKKYMEIIESRKAEMVAEQMEYLKKK